MIKKIILTVLLLFSSSLSYGQDGYKKIIKYVHDDLLKEHPEFDWYLSDFSPRTFKADLTGDGHQDLIVEWKRYKAGGAIYVFKLGDNKAKLILKKESYEVFSKPVSWGNQIGLLLGLWGSCAGVFVFNFDQSPYKNVFSKVGFSISAKIVDWKIHKGLLLSNRGWNGEDSTAQLFLYKGEKFTSVLDYFCSNCMQQVGCGYQTLLDDANGMSILYELEGHRSSNTDYDCYKIHKCVLTWDESSSKFEIGLRALLKVGEVEPIRGKLAQAIGLTRIDICAK